MHIRASFLALAGSVHFTQTPVFWRLRVKGLIEKLQEVLQPLEPCLLPSSVNFCANYRISHVIYIERISRILPSI